MGLRPNKVDHYRGHLLLVVHACRPMCKKQTSGIPVNVLKANSLFVGLLQNQLIRLHKVTLKFQCLNHVQVGMGGVNEVCACGLHSICLADMLATLNQEILNLQGRVVCTAEDRAQ